MSEGRDASLRRVDPLRFCIEMELEGFDSQHPFSPAPSLHVVEAFLRSIARSLKGRLDTQCRITINIVEKYWRELRHLIKSTSGYKYPAEAA